MGRKAYLATEAQRALVKSLSGFGIPQLEIAKHLRINKSTLLKHFPYELDDGMLTANSNVAKWLFDNCRKGNVTAQIFWCKTRMGWKEVTQTEITGKNSTNLIAVLEVVTKAK